MVMHHLKSKIATNTNEDGTFELELEDMVCVCACLCRGVCIRVCIFVLFVRLVRLSVYLREHTHPCVHE